MEIDINFIHKEEVYLLKYFCRIKIILTTEFFLHKNKGFLLDRP